MQVHPSPSGAQVNVTNCDREPIHIPGAVQPHGFLLALHESESAGEWRVSRASESCIDHLGLSATEVLGQPLEQVLPAAAAEALQAALLEPDLKAVNPIKLEWGEQHHLDAVVHRSHGQLVVEFEPSLERDTPSFSRIYRRVQSAIEVIESARSRESLYQATAEHVKQLSGYQRVMIYQFDNDWNGKVVAEAREDHLEPYLGLHYPASDIPVQARGLYLKNRLRIIPAVDYQPSPIVTSAELSGQGPLDLSYSVLRSVSPMHVQYLKNMGVGASMSISIIKDGELWGLIALHHNQAKYVPYEVRQGLELVGRLFAIQLAAKAQREDQGYKNHLCDLQAQLVDKMRVEPAFIEGLVRHQPSYLQLARGVTGGAIVHQGKTTLLGDAPPEGQVAGLVQWLYKNHQDVPVFHSTSLSALYPPAEHFAKVASGLLAISIPELEPSYVLWFKPEVVQTVDWAGNPEKPMSVSQDGSDLSPRRSFALWQETVKLRSLPWAQEEVEIAEILRRSVVEVNLERQIKTAMASNAELDQFATVISHDLKEPLRGIKAFAEFLQEDLRDSIAPESAGNLSDIEQLAAKAQQLISELYEYSRVGRVELAFQEVDLNVVLDEVLGRLKPFLEENAAQVVTLHRLPTVLCDRIRMGEVFYNLLVNAVKYNAQPRKTVEIGTLESDGAPILYVRDNGIGVPEEDRERIFRMFQRLHRPADYGGGTGVGLAIVKRIIDRHGGRIWLESTPGAGSTFHFTLRPEPNSVLAG